MVKTREDVLKNLTIYRGFSPQEFNPRIEKNREKFEKACRKQGKYLPSDDEMNRWFKSLPYAANDRLVEAARELREEKARENGNH